MGLSVIGPGRATTFSLALCLGGVIHFLAGDHSGRATLVFAGGAIGLICLVALVWSRRADAEPTDWLFAAFMLCLAGFYGFEGIAQLVFLLGAFVLGVAFGARGWRRQRHALA